MAWRGLSKLPRVKLGSQPASWRSASRAFYCLALKPQMEREQSCLWAKCMMSSTLEPQDTLNHMYGWVRLSSSTCNPQSSQRYASDRSEAAPVSVPEAVSAFLQAQESWGNVSWSPSTLLCSPGWQLRVAALLVQGTKLKSRCSFRLSRC